MSENSLTVVNDKGDTIVLYEPLPHQAAFHASGAPNLLALGTRGTGKSLMLRMDAILRCLSIPNFRALILRRTMPELRRSHLAYIDYEMRMLGGTFLHTTFIAKFPNGSTIQFGHCETEADILNYLSSEYGSISFDELSTWTLNQFLQISAAARAPEGCGYKAVIRAGSNPLGIGAEWMRNWFVTKEVRMEDFPDYNPNDFEMQFSTLDDNPYLNRDQYTARLKNLPEHVRKAWLLGEFVTEGAYFIDFMKSKEVNGKVIPWHCTGTMPTWRSKEGQVVYAHTLQWINIYRSIDWGYFPDPAVCHWHIVLPNKKKITFREQTWTRTLAADVAQAIKRASDGMHIVESYCDPTMFIKTGNAPYSIGEIFEQNGVPLVPSQNDRELYGYSVHEMLNTIIDDGPSWQIVEYACPELVRTLPILQMDKGDPRKIADGPDHWVVSCAYFAMSGSPPSRDPAKPATPRWMQPKKRGKSIYGI